MLVGVKFILSIPYVQVLDTLHFSDEDTPAFLISEIPSSKKSVSAPSILRRMAAADFSPAFQRRVAREEFKRRVSDV